MNNELPTLEEAGWKAFDKNTITELTMCGECRFVEIMGAWRIDEVAVELLFVGRSGVTDAP